MITTGGTIASIPSNNGLIPKISGKDIISLMPELKNICTIDTLELLNIDSSNISKKHYILCALFLLLLTIVIYGLAKAVMGMAFSSNKEENLTEIKEKVVLDWTMYVPQIVMLLIAFGIGIYMPRGLSEMVLMAVAGF